MVQDNIGQLLSPSNTLGLGWLKQALTDEDEEQEVGNLQGWSTGRPPRHPRLSFNQLLQPTSLHNRARKSRAERKRRSQSRQPRQASWTHCGDDGAGDGDARPSPKRTPAGGQIVVVEEGVGRVLRHTGGERGPAARLSTARLTALSCCLLKPHAAAQDARRLRRRYHQQHRGNRQEPDEASPARENEGSSFGQSSGLHARIVP